MLYKEIEGLKPSLFKRLTGVKKEVFAQMLDSVTEYKQSRRKHMSRGVAAKLSYADKILLLLKGGFKSLTQRLCFVNLKIIWN